VRGKDVKKRCEEEEEEEEIWKVRRLERLVSHFAD
jgi:hypothetical protein